MTDDRDVEAQLWRHLAAEADELPFLLDAAALHSRLDQRRGRWWRPLALLPIAAVLVLAVAVGGTLLASPGRDRSGGPQPRGPLAVMQMSGGMDALTTGVLRVTDWCVLLETAGGELELLVWPADRTRWDAATGTVRFTNPPLGPEFTLQDGQAVSLGGGGDSTDEGGVTAAEWVASIDWVAEPDSSCPMDIRWYVSSVVAQGPAAGANVVIESERFPGVEIACRGEVDMDADACRSWGDELLAGRPLAADGVTLVVLTANAGDARCAADFYVAADEPYAATAAARCPASLAPTDSTPPMQNALEAVIADALAVLGLEAQRAEYSPTSAFMWVQLDGDAALYVHALPTGTDGGEFSVIDERLIAGRTVEQVEYASGPVRDRFECDDATYEVEGDTPPGFASLDAFLFEFIAILGCGAPEVSPDASGATAELVGVIRGEPDLEGGICPVLLTDDEGDDWEVYLEEPYQREYRGEELVVIGPGGEIVARSGDRVGFTVRRQPGMGSHCQVGLPVIAMEIVFVESADQ